MPNSIPRVIISLLTMVLSAQADKFWIVLGKICLYNFWLTTCIYTQTSNAVQKSVNLSEVLKHFILAVKLSMIKCFNFLHAYCFYILHKLRQECRLWCGAYYKNMKSFEIKFHHAGLSTVEDKKNWAQIQALYANVYLPTLQK